MTATKTRAKPDVLAELTMREQAVTDAKAEADRLGAEHGQKSRQAQALADHRRQLIAREPGLANHRGEPNEDVPGNPLAELDAQLEGLGDVGDLWARYQHASKLRERAEQGVRDYAAAHLDAIIAALEPAAESATDALVQALADLAGAANGYLQLAYRVNQLKGTDRRRQGLRVPAIDVGADLKRLAQSFDRPPSPTELR